MTTDQRASGAPPEAPAPNPDPSTYHQAVAAGTMRALAGTSEYQLVRLAGADAIANGITDEIGALRLVLARLVNEQQDLKALAEGVVKVTSVAIRAAQVHHALVKDAATGDGQHAFAVVLDDIASTRDRADDDTTP